VGVTGRSRESDTVVGREVVGILIDPDALGTVVRVRNDHQSVCKTLSASNTEAYFLRKSAAIAWISADGGEWNLAARGFLQALDAPAAVGAVSGPVLLVGEDSDGEMGDVPSDLVMAARRYGLLL
jgi:hypothetical protein